jgi:hypothetical protein
MSHVGQFNNAPPPPYGAQPGYYPPPQATVIYQAVGNCPSCRVSL